MLEKWNCINIAEPVIVSYLAAGSDTNTQCVRPLHTFLLGDPEGLKRYTFTDGTVFESGPGDFRYLPQGSTYRIERLLPGGCWGIEFQADKPLFSGPFKMHISDYEGLKKLFQEAMAAKNQTPALRSVVVRRCIYAILEHLYLEEERSRSNHRRQQLLQPVLDEINRALQNESVPHMAQLAQKCCLSPAYMRQLFWDQYGMSPKAYLTQRRMERAVTMLQNGSTVAQTAAACGYAEPCHFSREFSRYTGISPKRYQRAGGAD